MLLKFKDNTFLEKPAGSKLIGLKHNGHRPLSVELDYYDIEKIITNDMEYFVHLWHALARDPRVEVIKYLGKESK